MPSFAIKVKNNKQIKSFSVSFAKGIYWEFVHIKKLYNQESTILVHLKCEMQYCLLWNFTFKKIEIAVYKHRPSLLPSSLTYEYLKAFVGGGGESRMRLITDKLYFEGRNPVPGV
jgi:hypothetical protein